VARDHGLDQPRQRGGGHHPQAVRDQIERNCVHGSDAPETAETELRFFFSTADLL